MNWSNSYSILLISSLLCRCGNKLLSKYFKCTFNILFKFSHCWQQMIDRVRLKRNCGVASVGEETQKIVFFFTIGPLSQFTTTEWSWSSHLSKHVALCQFELRQRIADLLRQRASAQNISLSTLIFMVSFQVQSWRGFLQQSENIYVVNKIKRKTKCEGKNRGLNMIDFS